MVMIAVVDFPLELSDGKQIIKELVRRGEKERINGIDRYWLKNMMMMMIPMMCGWVTLLYLHSSLQRKNVPGLLFVSEMKKGGWLVSVRTNIIIWCEFKAGPGLQTKPSQIDIFSLLKNWMSHLPLCTSCGVMVIAGSLSSSVFFCEEYRFVSSRQIRMCTRTTKGMLWW